MPAVVWKDSQGRLFMDPAHYPGAVQDAQGRLTIDEAQSGGLAYYQNNKFYTLDNIQGVDLTWFAGAFFNTPEWEYLTTYIYSFFATGAFSIKQMSLAKVVKFFAAGLFRKGNDAQRTHAFAGTGTYRPPLRLNVAFRSFLATGTFMPKKFMYSLTQFIAFGAADITGALTRTNVLIEEATQLFLSILRGRRGTMPLTYRIVKSDISGTDLGQIPGVLGTTGSVSMSNARDHGWELSFEMRQNDFIDPVRDYVKVYADVDLGDGSTESYPLGLYRLRKPSGRLQKSHRVWQCQGFSLEDLLARHDCDKPYGLGKGVDILQTVEDIIVARAGVPADRILFPSVRATTRRQYQFDPSTGGTGTSWLAICNDLLETAGYYALQTDADGNFMTEKMGSSNVIQPDVEYEESYENMIVGEIADNWDDERFANKVVVKSQDVADAPVLVSKAYNNNPDSEGSTVYLGRTIQKTISLNTATSKSDMDTMAQAELEKASGYYRKLTLTSLFDPRVFKPRTQYGLFLTDADGNTVVDGRWQQVSVTVPLANPPTAMTHEVSRVEEI